MICTVPRTGRHLMYAVSAIILCAATTLRCQEPDIIPLPAAERWESYDISSSRATGNLRTQIRNAFNHMDKARAAYRGRDLKRTGQLLNAAAGVLKNFSDDPAAQPVLACIRTNLGLCYYEDHHFEAAGEELTAAAVLRLNLSTSERDSALAGALENLGAFCNNRNDLGMADSLLRIAMNIRRTISGGKPHARLASAIYNAGIVNERAKDYAPADSFFTEAITMTRSLDSIDKGTRAIALLERTALLYQRRGAFTRAEILALDALSMRQRIAKKGTSPEIVRVLGLLGMIRDSMGNAAGADSCYVVAFRQARRLPKRNDSLLAGHLAALGNFRAREGNLNEAVDLLSEAAQQYRRAFGRTERLELARVLGLLGTLYEQRGDYPEAVRSLTDALAIYRVLQRGLDGYEHAAVYAGLGRSWYGMGDYTKAAEMYRMGLRMYRFRDRLGDNPHHFIADILIGLGNIYLDRGNYPAAEGYFDEGMEMYEDLRADSTDPGYAVALRYAARYYHQRGDLQKAGDMLSQARGTFLRLGNRRYDRHEAMALKDLAAIRSEQGDISGAIVCAEAAQPLFERVHGNDDHYDLAATLSTIAALSLQQGDNANAGSRIKRALAMYQRLYGRQFHPDYAAAMGTMALYLARTGNSSAAAGYFSRAGAMYKALHEKNGHPNLVFGLYGIARSAESAGMRDQARLCYKNIMWMLPRMMREASLFEGEDQQIRFQKRLSQMSSSLLTFFYDTGETGELFNAALWAKGRVLSAIEWRNRAIADLRRGDAGIDSLWRTFQAGRRFLSDTYVPAGGDDLAEWRRDRDSMLALLERIEGKIASAIAAVKKKKGREDSWSATAKLLRPGECAIEFIRIPFPGPTGSIDSVKYCALVLRSTKGWGTRPHLVELCDENSLGDILRHTVGPRESKSYVHDANRAQKLYDLVWKPLVPALEGITTMYMSTDGLLNSVSFAALEDILDEKELLGRYDLRHLFSTRDLLASRRGESSRHERSVKTAAVFGAVSFDADSAELAGQMGFLAEGGRGHENLYDMQPDRAPDIPSGEGEAPRAPGPGSRLQPLPGSKRETDSIVAILERGGYNTRGCMGGRATEENFIALQSPSVVHVASHAVVFPEPGNSEQAAAMRDSGGIRILQYAESPLLRSMLMLAGANRVWTLRPPLRGIGDGLVTAYDVAQMSLNGTELVVLSACETGLGEIMQGEGVFGLKRAFRAAGAGAVIISLWKVPDEQTRMLMELFYQNWVEKGMEKSRALAEAQKTMREKEDLDAYYWGAFVLVGE